MKNTFSIFEGLPDYAIMYLQEQCKVYLTMPGVKEYIENNINISSSHINLHFIQLTNNIKYQKYL